MPAKLKVLLLFYSVTTLVLLLQGQWAGGAVQLACVVALAKRSDRMRRIVLAVYVFFFALVFPWMVVVPVLSLATEIRVGEALLALVGFFLALSPMAVTFWVLTRQDVKAWMKHAHGTALADSALADSALADSALSSRLSVDDGGAMG